MMPTSSISAGVAWPTAYPIAQRRILGTRASRAAGDSSLLSRTPDGARRTDSSMRTIPTETGPLSAPRPTSSTEHTMTAPESRSWRSTRRLGREPARVVVTVGYSDAPSSSSAGSAPGAVICAGVRGATPSGPSSIAGSP
jgi:hypothetical protein